MKCQRLFSGKYKNINLSDEFSQRVVKVNTAIKGLFS